MNASCSKPCPFDARRSLAHSMFLLCILNEALRAPNPRVTINSAMLQHSKKTNNRISKATATLSLPSSSSSPSPRHSHTSPATQLPQSPIPSVEPLPHTTPLCRLLPLLYTKPIRSKLRLCEVSAGPALATTAKFPHRNPPIPTHLLSSTILRGPAAFSSSPLSSPSFNNLHNVQNGPPSNFPHRRSPLGWQNRCGTSLDLISSISRGPKFSAFRHWHLSLSSPPSLRSRPCVPSSPRRSSLSECDN